jgi:DNA repair protein RadA/Sms
MKLQGIDLRSLDNGTNILELEVPPQLDVQHETGISFIDDVFSGGMTPSTACLFTGTPGAGKTTLMLQLADSLTAKGHIVLFNTAEESLLQVRKVVRRLNLKHGFVCGQDRELPAVLKHATFLRKKNPTKQLFMMFDSLATLDDGKYGNGHTNSNTAVRCAEDIAGFCKNPANGYPIAWIIGHVTKSGDFAGKQTIKHAVDVHAHVFVDMMKTSPTYGERIFEVQKNRFGCAGLAYILDLGASGFKEKGSVYDVATSATI